MFKKIVWLGFSNKWKKAKDVSKYIKSLVDNWVSEFFTWYNPSYWYKRFWFEVSPNGRFAEHEQITDYETLKRIVEEVHTHKLEIFWNLNAWYYSDETFPLIKKMLDELIKLWIDWIICWNIWILEYLKNIWYKGKINISTILALYNSQSIKFILENYDINKIILSREITIKEIEELVLEFPETKFEVFGEWDFCRYNNGLCFAEHKYWDKDICTVVVNDLVIKKKFNANFKEILLDKQKNNFEKMKIFDDIYENEFKKIDKLIEWIELWFSENLDQEKKIIVSLIKILKKKTDLYYDWLKWIWTERNQKIINLLKYLKYIETYTSEFILFKTDLERNIKLWVKYYFTKLKTLWQWKIKALEIWSFYSKWDHLNLYSYLFFSKFKNIDTVKFPTRWRDYSKKIKLIENVLQNWKVSSELFDRSISIERTHYDLTYLFWDKYRFKDMLNK